MNRDGSNVERISFKQGARYAVDLQEGFVGPLAQQIRRLAAELVGYGLYDEYEQNGEPHVACAAEAGRVEQRERTRKMRRRMSPAS